jgi:hypothetical protein
MHTDLNEIKDPKLTLARVDSKHKVKCCVVPVDKLRVLLSHELTTVEKVAHVVRSLGHEKEALADYCECLCLRRWVVELGKTRLWHGYTAEEIPTTAGVGSEQVSERAIE